MSVEYNDFWIQMSKTTLYSKSIHRITKLIGELCSRQCLVKKDLTFFHLVLLHARKIAPLVVVFYGIFS